VHKLHRATEDTKNYIQLLASNKIPKKQVPSIHSWLSSICDEDVALVLNEKDFSIAANPYWLHVCLKNLIKNAKDHGGDKVTVTLTEHRTDLEISVIDSGSGLSSSLSDLTNEFSKGAKSSGLGLGLSIVAKAAELMDSGLTYSDNPSQFSLKFKKGQSTYAADSYS